MRVKTVKIEIQDGRSGNLEFSINHQILKGDIAKTARWPSVFSPSDVWVRVWVRYGSINMSCDIRQGCTPSLSLSQLGRVVFGICTVSECPAALGRRVSKAARGSGRSSDDRVS